MISFAMAAPLTRVSLPRSNRGLLAIVCACLGLGLPMADAAGELAPLNGRWRGPAIELLIDTDRMQANTDMTRPFTRVPLVIRNITGPLFFFSIGRDTFIGRVEGETLSLTRLGTSGATILTRMP